VFGSNSTGYLQLHRTSFSNQYTITLHLDILNYTTQAHKMDDIFGDLDIEGEGFEDIIAGMREDGEHVPRTAYDVDSFVGLVDQSQFDDMKHIRETIPKGSPYANKTNLQMWYQFVQLHKIRGLLGQQATPGEERDAETFVGKSS